MKILVVAGWMYPDAEGGSYRVVYEAGRRLAERGHEVHVATQRLDPSHHAEETVAGMHVHRYETTAKSGARFYWSTLRAVRRLATRLQGEVGFDVVHTHHPVSAFAALRVRALRAVPAIATVHSLSFLEHMDRRSQERPGRRIWGPATVGLVWLENVILERSRRAVVLSDFTRELVSKFFPRHLHKVLKLPGGADMERFRPEPSRGEARRRLRLPADRPVFFTCRRLEHRMGLPELVEAAALLLDSGRAALVLIGGRGALEEALKQQVRDLRLESVVRLLGYVAEADLPLYYRAADCFVLPTRALEGFGLATAEALACGTPVLGTPVGATPELLGPLDPRLLTRDATAAGLAEGMMRFLDELAAEPGLEERCRAYAEEHLSWEPFVDGLEKVSREAAGQ